MGFFLRHGQDIKGQTLGGFGANARQTGELFAEPFQGGGKVLHDLEQTSQV